MTITDAMLANWFSYSVPEGDDEVHYENIRAAGLNLAEIVVTHTPPGSIQMEALRLVRQAVQVANDAVALRNRSENEQPAFAQYRQ